MNSNTLRHTRHALIFHGGGHTQEEQEAVKEDAERADAVAQARILEKENKKTKFSEQCFLVDNMEIFSERNRIREEEYQYITKLISKEPSLILNKFNARPNVEAMFNITPAQVAALVPKVRLYKVFLDEQAPRRVVELKFNDSTSKTAIDNMLKTKFGRGDGVGIQNVSIETQGTNPAEGALVRTSIQIYFQNLETLANRKNRESDYLELILRRNQFEKTKDARGITIPGSSKINPNYFKLVASVGWALPEGSFGKNDKALRKVLKRCTQTVFLTLIHHDLQFEQDGTAVLTADYQGALDIMLNYSDFDVLSIGDQSALETQDNTLEYKENRLAKDKKEISESENFNEKQKTEKAKAIDKKLKELRKQRTELSDEARTIKYSRILTDLYTRDKISSIRLTKEEIENYENGVDINLRAIPLTRDDIAPPGSEGYTGDIANFKKAIKKESSFFSDINPRNPLASLALKVWGTPAKKLAAKASEALTPATKDGLVISYFYFGDLVEVAARMLEQNRANPAYSKTLPDIRLMLGPVTYDVVRPGGAIETRTMNIADVPVSLKSFEFWFNKNVVKRKADSWPIRSFLKSAVSELVLNALGEACSQTKGVRRRNRIGLQNLMAPGVNGKHRMPTGEVDLDVSTKVVNGFAESFPMSTMEKTSFNKYKHYILIYGANEVPDERDPRKRDSRGRLQDFKDGVYHFIVGAEGGLLKSINFNRTDVPFLKEARLTAQDAEEGQLRDKYDATLELVGSSALFTPGQKVYINPTLAGLDNPTRKDSIARQLGLGGYYDIVSVKTSVGVSGFTTSLDCRWVSFGLTEGSRKKAEAARRRVSGEDSFLPPMVDKPHDGEQPQERSSISESKLEYESSASSRMEEEQKKEDIDSEGNNIDNLAQQEVEEPLPEYYEVEITAQNRQKHINTFIKFLEKRVDNENLTPAARKEQLDGIKGVRASLESGEFELQALEDPITKVVVYSAQPAGQPGIADADEFDIPAEDVVEL